MRSFSKLLGVFVLSVLFAGTVLAGGIVTNTNQSADFIRMLNRNASTDLDAVYYNPAGLTQLNSGLHLYVSNQYISQTREINANYPNFNSNSYEGETLVPMYPNIYVGYKTGDLVISAGLAPVGGGGTAEYSDGLPSFEFPVASLVGIPAGQINPALEPYGTITGYSMDMNFEGSSIYLGGQAGLSYALTDIISIAAGVRYVSGKNTYQGTLENVVLQAENGPIAGVIQDIAVDAKSTGTGISGIAGVAVNPGENLHVGLKYESLTKIELSNETEEDGTGLFPDGAKTQADIPATLTAGLSYRILPNLSTALSFTYFMNEGADWNGSEQFVDNGSEYGIGIEYGLSSALLVSAGYLHSEMGATDTYQSDMNFSLNSNSIGAGLKYRVAPGFAIGAGVLNTIYEEGQNDTDVPVFMQTFNKSATVFSVGIGYSL